MLKSTMVSTLVLLCLASCASAGCSCRGSAGGGVGYDFLMDPAFNGMASDFEAMMRSATVLSEGGSPPVAVDGIKIGSAALPKGKSAKEKPICWKFVLNGSIPAEMTLFQVGDRIFGKGNITYGQNSSVTGSGSLKDGVMRLDLVDPEGALYRLEMKVEADQANGRFRAASSDGRIWSGPGEGTLCQGI